MAGESPATIPFGGDKAYVDLYDWRELKRWKIPETAVPPGAIVRYRQLSLWEEHRWEIIGTFFLIATESALILGLIVNLRRRKKVEQSLTESEMRLKLAADSAGAGLWSLDVGTGRIWATERALELYGFVPGELVDFEKFLMVVHDEDRERIVHVIEDAVRDKGVLSVEYRITLPDGSIRWMAVRGSYIPSPGGSSRSDGRLHRHNREKEHRGGASTGEAGVERPHGKAHHRPGGGAEPYRPGTPRRYYPAARGPGHRGGNVGTAAGTERAELSGKTHTIKESLVRLSEDIHALSRQLHPSILDDLGLVRAVEAEIARFTEKERIRVLFNHEDLPPAIPRDIALALYRVTQEGLRNIARHSGATSAHVELKSEPGAIHLTVADTGCGFDTASVGRILGWGWRA